MDCPACHAPAAPDALRCATCGAPLPVRADGGSVQRGEALTAGAWSKLTRVCGWCDAKTKDPHDGACDQCGGPLPPLPRRVLAELALGAPEVPPPPAAPRTLPRGYETRVRYWKNVSVMIGMIFTIVFFWSVLFPLVGIGLWWYGARQASRWLRALTGGTAVEGTLTRVFVDTSQHIDREHPWRLDYRFETPGGPVEGHVISWDPLSGRREAGERVWVVFDPEEPAVANALWPPVA
jgi:hypothetical protein